MSKKPNHRAHSVYKALYGKKHPEEPPVKRSNHQDVIGVCELVFESVIEKFVQQGLALCEIHSIFSKVHDKLERERVARKREMPRSFRDLFYEARMLPVRMTEAIEPYERLYTDARRLAANYQSLGRILRDGVRVQDSVLIGLDFAAHEARIVEHLQREADNPTNPNDRQSRPSYYNPDGNIRGFRRR